MLLNTAISAQQSLHAQLQIQIDDLQAKQREIQAYMQQLGSVESSMESAAQMLQQAIAEIRAVCPGELDAYQTLITGMFNDTPVAQLQPVGADSTTDDTIVTPPSAPTPAQQELQAGELVQRSASTDDAIAVDAVTVVDPADATTATQHEVATTVIIPTVNGTTNGTAKVVLSKAGAVPVKIPTVSQINNMRKTDVQYWLAHFDLDSDGKSGELRQRLTAHLLSSRNLTNN